MIFKFVIRCLNFNTMMDDKDERCDIPDKLRFDIRAYARGLFIRSLTVCFRHFAFRGRGQMAPVRVHEYNEIVSRDARDAHQYVLSRRSDDIIIMKHVISQSVNCTESKDGWACPGKSDATSNIPEGVVKPPEWGGRRGSFINGY